MGEIDYGLLSDCKIMNNKEKVMLGLDLGRLRNRYYLHAYCVSTCAFVSVCVDVCLLPQVLKRI